MKKIQMEYIKDLIEMASEKAKELFYGIIKNILLVNGKKEQRMVMENGYLRKEIHIKEIGKLIDRLAQEYSSIKIAYIQANLKIF